MSPSTSSTDRPDGGALLEVGRIGRAHGVRGDVVVTLTTNRAERVEPGRVLRTSSGQALEVLASRPHQEKWIVTFRGLDDRNAAERMRGTVLLAEPIDDPEELWVHELVGSEVVDADGTVRGVVEAVQENPAADLLVLADGTLVPVVFVTDRQPGRLVIDAPEGLFDL